MKMSNPLFKLSDIQEEQQVEIFSEATDVIDSSHDVLFCKSTDVLNDLFPSLNPNISRHYVSYGNWSMHELLLHLLDLTGPAEVYFTTWSLKEYPVRLMIDAIEKGKITKLCAILDSRVKIRNQDVYFLAKTQFTTLKLYDCHAKVCVIISHKWKISIVGSANMTNNPRVEAGVLSTHEHIADFHKNWILRVMEMAHPFE
jgi:hypothetical protein